MDFASIYDLMPDGCRHGLGKDAWLKQVRYESPGRIKQFVVEEVYAGNYTGSENLSGEKWIVKGCGTYQVGNKSVNYQASIDALLLNGEWYICRSGIAVESTDNQYIHCSK